MGRPPCCDKVGVKKGPWTPEEDLVLVSYVQEHGPGNWRSVPASTGLARCSKSCRLRWTNYLRPGIRRGGFTAHEDAAIAHLQSLLGNKWAAIATYLPRRTDNDVKNYWNTHLKKRLQKQQAVGAIFAPPQPEPAACSSSLPYASSVDNISRLLDGFMKASPPPPASPAPATTTRPSQSAASEAKDRPGHAAVHFVGAGQHPLFPAFHDDGCCISGSFAGDQQQQQVPLSSIEEWLLDEAAGPTTTDQLASSSSDECYSVVPMLF